MVNGQTKRSEYRIFKIKTVRGTDDYASIREVVTRRFCGLQKRGDRFPDLLLIDGGKGQLSSALAALHALDIFDVPVLGLAKRLEELFQPDSPKAILLPKTSAALRMLQLLRDEAHRFANSHHRKQRTARTLRTVLTDIEGIGVSRAKTLLRKFGSVRCVREATEMEIATLEGFSRALAQRVLTHLRLP
jgi:excinuclease ABC subunit C